MTHCWCQGYRAAEMGAGVVHERGKRHASGDCMYAAPDKDNAMRDQVRTSFERVSEGLVAFVEKDQLPGPMREQPVVPCEQLLPGGEVARVTADRDALLHMVEQLLEQEIPCVDMGWYHKRVQEIKRRG